MIARKKLAWTLVATLLLFWGALTYFHVRFSVVSFPFSANVEVFRQELQAALLKNNIQLVAREAGAGGTIAVKPTPKVLFSETWLIETRNGEKLVLEPFLDAKGGVIKIRGTYGQRARLFQIIEGEMK